MPEGSEDELLGQGMAKGDAVRVVAELGAVDQQPSEGDKARRRIAAGGSRSDGRRGGRSLRAVHLLGESGRVEVVVEDLRCGRARRRRRRCRAVRRRRWRSAGRCMARTRRTSRASRTCRWTGGGRTRPCRSCRRLRRRRSRPSSPLLRSRTGAWRRAGCRGSRHSPARCCGARGPCSGERCRDCPDIP